MKTRETQDLSSRLPLRFTYFSRGRWSFADNERLLGFLFQRDALESARNHPVEWNGGRRGRKTFSRRIVHRLFAISFVPKLQKSAPLYRVPLYIRRERRRGVFRRFYPHTPSQLITFFSRPSRRTDFARERGITRGWLCHDVRREENARTIKPNDPLFRPRIIPARASCQRDLRLTETNESPLSRIHFIRGKERLFRKFHSPPSHPYVRAPTLHEPTRRDALDTPVFQIPRPYVCSLLFTGLVWTNFISDRSGGSSRWPDHVGRQSVIARPRRALRYHVQTSPLF